MVRGFENSIITELFIFNNLSNTDFVNDILHTLIFYILIS